jgi:hypothetical protein
MPKPAKDLRKQLAQAFSKTATANGVRLRQLRFDLADAALEVFDEDAQARHVADLMEHTRLRSMQIREGAFDMDIDAAREITTEYVAAARAMLGDAENYTETPVEFTVGLAGQERYVLIVQRAGKLTPHQARKRAEAERDEWKRAAEAEAQGGKARAEMLARVEAALVRIRELAAEQQYAIAESAMADAADLLDAALSGTGMAGDA